MTSLSEKALEILQASGETNFTSFISSTMVSPKQPLKLLLMSLKMLATYLRKNFL